MEDIGHDVANHLTAIHTLSGCDTTSKVGSKTALIGLLPDYPGILDNFGVDTDNDEFEAVEEMLVKSLRDATKSSKAKTFNVEI